MSIVSVAAALIYIGRSIAVLYNVKEYEKTLEDDDALKWNDDFIWWAKRNMHKNKVNSWRSLLRIVYITTLFVGFCLLISSIYMLIGSPKVSQE